MPPVVSHRNRVVRVDGTGIVENALTESFLSADIAASSSTLTVANIEGFAVGKYVWINPFSERSEIIAMHASTDPSGSTLTLADNTTYAHYTGEPVYYVEFNEVEVSHASTLTGSKTTLDTVSLFAGARETTYLDTSNTSGYYFARYKDSVATTYSSYSDGVLYGGYPQNSVGYMIDRSLADLELNLSDKVTLVDCLAWINDGLRTIQGKLRRWPELYSWNTIVGQVQRGTNVLAMPSDIYDTKTNKSILAVRIGTDKQLIYQDPTQFDANLNMPDNTGVIVTQVRSQASAGDTSLALNNSYDFPDSGTVHVFISNTQYAITYTGVTRDDVTGATAALTGIPASGTGSISLTIPANTYVWQNEVEGIPTYYTVRGGNIEWWPLADGTMQNSNLYMDYSKSVTAVDSEDDSIDFQRFDILQPYLTWRIYSKVFNRGILDFGQYLGVRRFIPNGWYNQYQEKLKDTLQTLPQTNVYKMRPLVNTMSRYSFNKRQADVQNLPPSQQ